MDKEEAEGGAQATDKGGSKELIEIDLKKLKKMEMIEVSRFGKKPKRKSKK